MQPEAHRSLHTARSAQPASHELCVVQRKQQRRHQSSGLSTGACAQAVSLVDGCLRLLLLRTHVLSFAVIIGTTRQCESICDVLNALPRTKVKQELQVCTIQTENHCTCV